MERLQSAIEKARKQRGSTGFANAPLEPSAQEASASANWNRIMPGEIDPRISGKNRVVSLVQGGEAAPYDLLRTRILQQASANNWRRIAVVSSRANSGKTTTVANLAFSFSRQTDLRFVALDLDLRRIGLAHSLGLRVRTNMSHVLQGEIDFLDHAVCLNNNVALGLNSSPVSNASELLQSQKTKLALEKIETQLDPKIMLFDLPPLMSTDDNIGFLKYVDCAVLIAEAEKSTINEIDAAERQLADLTNVMGVVLNKCRYNSGSYAYDYDYEY